MPFLVIKSYMNYCEIFPNEKNVPQTFPRHFFLDYNISDFLGLWLIFKQGWWHLWNPDLPVSPSYYLSYFSFQLLIQKPQYS